MPYLAIAAAISLVLMASIAVATEASRRRWRRSALARAGDLRRISRVAERAVHSEDALDVVLAAQDELVELLGLRGCRFEAPPFASFLERLDRSGAVSWREYRRVGAAFVLPVAGVELPVLGSGRLLGRFVLLPDPNRGVPLEERVVAVAIADQVGLALAAPQPGREPRHG